MVKVECSSNDQLLAALRFIHNCNIVECDAEREVVLYVDDKCNKLEVDKSVIRSHLKSFIAVGDCERTMFELNEEGFMEMKRLELMEGNIL